ncbi:MAG: hypothetical protein E7616_09055 [Ruminococcaceae bacterium]|nr:hypothetical protein [Oscillospiraceae bacterium]
MDQSKLYFPVNDLAPKDEKETTVFFKKLAGSKSDGFVVVDNEKVFVIDIGKRDDLELIHFLAALRNQWLGEGRLSNGDAAKLALTLIISHSHGDHIGALPHLINDERFCITDIYAPKRPYLSLDVSGALPPLVENEDRLESICEALAQKGHTAKGITRMPYGRVYSIPSGSADFVLKIFPSHIDWSEDRPCDQEGFRFLRANNPTTYQDDPILGYTNGILNGNSLWVKVIKGERSILITGDQRDSDEMLGAMLRHYGAHEFACDVLKLPHHGQKNYPPYLLSAASPQFTVFTSSFEKATADTVKLCKEMGCVSYYTGDGNLFFHIREKEIKVSGIDPR